MDWFEPIRAYCERGGPGFWAEPLNAVSNAAFLAAAGLAAWRERTAPVRDPVCLGLAVLTGLVGLGSFLFHTLAVRWAMLADVVPIALFIHAYVFLALHRFLGLGIAAAALATLTFAAFGFGLGPALEAVTGRPAAEIANGSIEYLPAALALIGVAAALLARRDRPERRETALRLLGIAALFLLSLTVRTLDRAACAAFPLGTHAFWHLLNAAVLYGLIAAALRHRTRAGAA